MWISWILRIAPMSPVLDVVLDLSCFYLLPHHPPFKRSQTRVELLSVTPWQALHCPDDEAVPLTALSHVAPLLPVGWNREARVGGQSPGCSISQPAFEGDRDSDSLLGTFILEDINHCHLSTLILLINSLNLFSLFFLLPCCMACGILVSPTRDWTSVPCSGSAELNHWTAKEVPQLFHS